MTATGTYLADEQVLQRNPLRPLRLRRRHPALLAGGGTLLVDRGWISPRAPTPTLPAADVTPPTGHVDVTVRAAQPTGVVRPPGAHRARSTTSPPSMADVAGDDLPQPVYAGYGELLDQDPPPDPPSSCADPIDTGHRSPSLLRHPVVALHRNRHRRLLRPAPAGEPGDRNAMPSVAGRHAAERGSSRSTIRPARSLN